MKHSTNSAVTEGEMINDYLLLCLWVRTNRERSRSLFSFFFFCTATCCSLSATTICPFLFFGIRQLVMWRKMPWVFFVLLLKPGQLTWRQAFTVFTLRYRHKKKCEANTSVINKKRFCPIRCINPVSVHPIEPAADAATAAPSFQGPDNFVCAAICLWV